MTKREIASARWLSAGGGGGDEAARGGGDETVVSKTICGCAATTVEKSCSRLEVCRECAVVFASRAIVGGVATAGAIKRMTCSWGRKVATTSADRAMTKTTRCCTCVRSDVLPVALPVEVDIVLKH